MAPSGSGSAGEGGWPAHGPPEFRQNSVCGIGSVGFVRPERMGTRGAVRPPPRVNLFGGCEAGLMAV